MILVPVYIKGVVVAHASLDDADAHLADHHWHLNPGGYVQRRSKNRSFYMHREVLGLKPRDGFEGDHINLDKLDNTRENLRVATRSQNAQNLPSCRNSTSRYRGVSWDARLGKWRASVKADGRMRTLGRFDSEDDAARAASEFRAQHMPFAVEVA